ncbi:MAG: zf-HC2 domain-containing protein [Phycisphaeraceae bacterium]|nr:zf-HC2 domain-containing protein [Phycisphaeraceae bacterium]
MNIKEHSESWEHMLTDYADGELPPDQMKHITEHLSHCESCRALVAALRQSLGHAQSIWQAYVEDPGQTVPIQRRWNPWKTVAAGLLLMLGLRLGWQWVSKPNEEPNIVQIQQEIEAYGQASRLLATAELLAQYAHHRELSQQQYQYIIATYPSTPAANAAKLKLAKL